MHQSLTAWRTALGGLAAALRDYVREAGDSGPRALGSRWAAAVRELAAAEDSLPDDPAPPADGPADPLANLMAAGDAFEGAMLRLEEAAVVILDPNVQHAISAGMSRTYSDNVRSLLRAIAAAREATLAGRRGALAAATPAGAALAAGLSAAAVAAAYGRAAQQGDPQRGGVATELYVSALLCLGSPAAAALLGSAKDAALGGAADTRAAAEADTEALAEYHPCQAMGYAPVLSAAPKGADGRGAVDISFPQARLAVSYDLAPLIDRRRALEYGPVAPATSGLNYRLVERFRTIRSEPVAAPAGPVAAPAGPVAEPAGRPAFIEGPLLVTADGGATVHRLGPAAGEWAPFAGAQPRVARYADASAAVILDRLRAEREAGWGEQMRAEYEAAVDSGLIPSGETSADAVADALAGEFERAYDAAPPADAREFRDLAVPETPRPGDYISAAVARLTGGALSARLRSALAQPSPRTPYAVVEREGRISQAILTLDVARGLWRRLKDAFWVDDEAFALPPVKRKETLLRHYRRLAADAAGAAPIYCAPPSLKLWAAGAATAGPRY